MDYKKIVEKNYNLHILKTDKFKTIMVKVNFKRKIKKEEISLRNMLVNVLFESTKKYQTKRLMEIQTEELYELGYRGTNYASGIYSVIGFDNIFIDPKYTEKAMLKKSFEFLREILFNPDVDENGFSENSFNIGHKILEDHLISLNENPDLYSQIRVMEELDPNHVFSYRNCGYAEILETITRKSLYEYYLDVLKNDIVDIFVVGNVDEEEIKTIVKELFLFENRNQKGDDHFSKSLLKRDKVNLCIENNELSQSKLVLGFKIDDTSDFELRYVLNVLNYILGGSPDSKLFQNVREKNSLCYTVSSSSQPLYSLLTIKAGINASDYDRACAIILEQVEDLKKGNFTEEDVKKAKITYENSINELKDNAESLISLYAGIEYLNSDTIEKRIKLIKKVKKADIIKLANCLVLDTIFFLEGGGK
jgi:Predicted Zn-dependent peptidases